MIDLHMEQIGAFLPLIIIILIIFLIIYFIRKKGKGKSVDLGLSINDYKDAKKLNNIFNVSLYILLIVWISVFLSDLIYAYTFNLDNYSLVDLIQILLAGIYTISYFIVFFIGGMWIYRINYNARCLGAKEMRYTPGWSVGWYFIPIVHLWKPYQAMKEIYLKTYNLNIEVSNINNVPGFFPLWWTFWLLGTFAGQIQFRLGTALWTSNSLDLWQLSNFVAVFTDILLILNWIFFYKIFKSIILMQEYLYNESKIAKTTQ